MKFTNYCLFAFIISFLACNSNGKTAAQKLGEIPLEGTYWKLMELNGKSVIKGLGNNELFFTLHHTDLHLAGNGGCNGFGGNYELNPNGVNIQFTQLIRTEMACENKANMDQENNFLKALETADSYFINGDQLQLNTGKMTNLAIFKAQPSKPADLLP